MVAGPERASSAGGPCAVLVVVVVLLMGSVMILRLLTPLATLMTFVGCSSAVGDLEIFVRAILCSC